jgi:hypothetical protein
MQRKYACRMATRSTYGIYICSNSPEWISSARKPRPMKEDVFIMWESLSGGCEEFCLLEHNAVLFDARQLMIRRRHTPPKRRQNFTRIHGVKLELVNIRVALKGTLWQPADWINLARSMHQCLSHANMVMTFWFHKSQGITSLFDWLS